MLPPSFRFSIRALLLCTAFLALLLAVGVRFGAHLLWLANRTGLPEFDAIPVATLAAERPTEAFHVCKIGPMSLELPVSMCEDVGVQRTPGTGSVNLCFSDAQRSAVVNLTPMKNVTLFPRPNYHDTSDLTELALYRQVASVATSDFSFRMTGDELRWHTWLMKNRRMLPEWETIESCEAPGLEANLMRLSSAAGTTYSYEWSTIDGQWRGTVTFHDSSDNHAWIRYAASTFTLHGTPDVFGIPGVDPLEEWQLQIDR